MNHEIPPPDWVRPLWRAGRLAWPDVTLSAAALARGLERRRQGGAEDPSLWEQHAGDLYLACACEERVPGALASFEAHFMVQVPSFLARLALPPDRLDEVRQLVREKLFVGPAGAAPRIGNYSGRGALSLWLRTLALRTALDLLGEEARRPAEESLSGVHAVALDPELGYLQQRYRAEFAAAVREALGGLPAERRNLLRLYVVAGLTTTRIGAMLGVTHSAVVKHLQATREAIFDETRRLLGARLGLSREEFDSLLRSLRSALDISLARLLGEDEDPR